MERHVWLRALAVSLAPPRSYRVSARMHRRNGLRAFRLHAIHDAPGHRGCVTNVISWGRNHRWPGIMSSSWSNVVYFPYSPCRVIKLIHLSQPLRSALPPITILKFQTFPAFLRERKEKFSQVFRRVRKFFEKNSRQTRLGSRIRRVGGCEFLGRWSTRAIEGGRERGQEFR